MVQQIKVLVTKADNPSSIHGRREQIMQAILISTCAPLHAYAHTCTQMEINANFLKDLTYLTSLLLVI